MTHASLFSGIGGPDLAAEKMGWENVFHCEINPFGQKILKYYWPNSISYEDIKTTDFSIHRGTIDVLTGGFPCQPYSVAGLRKGKEDERHLWPEMLRAIREIKPRWIVGENVLGLVGWNDGMVFEEVQVDLEAEGYEVQSYVLPAASVDAPHRRDRVWFVAHAKSNGSFRGSTVGNWSQQNQAEWSNLQQFFERPGVLWLASNTNCRIRRAVRRHETRVRRENKKFTKHRNFSGNGFITYSFSLRRKREQELSKREVKFDGDTWSKFPTQSPVCVGNDGFSTESLRHRIREDSMGYLSEKEIDKIISKAHTEWRTESIKAGGNAIVHQVILQIFKAIEEYERLPKMGSWITRL